MIPVLEAIVVRVPVNRTYELSAPAAARQRLAIVQLHRARIQRERERKREKKRERVSETETAGSLKRRLCAVLGLSERSRRLDDVHLQLPWEEHYRRLCRAPIALARVRLPAWVYTLRKPLSRVVTNVARLQDRAKLSANALRFIRLYSFIRSANIYSKWRRKDSLDFTGRCRKRSATVHYIQTKICTMDETSRFSAGINYWYGTRRGSRIYSLYTEVPGYYLNIALRNSIDLFSFLVKLCNTAGYNLSTSAFQIFVGGIRSDYCRHFFFNLRNSICSLILYFLRSELLTWLGWVIGMVANRTLCQIFFYTFYF